MKHTTDYSKMENSKRRALADNRFWLGNKYKEMMEVMLKSRIGGCDDDYFHFATSFMGIQGYPVVVMMEAIDRLIRMREHRRSVFEKDMAYYESNNLLEVMEIPANWESESYDG